MSTVQAPRASLSAASAETPELQIAPLSPAIGAIVGGIDLAQVPTPYAVRAITEGLLRHQVLFFREQRLTPRQHRDFAAAFGELHIHPIYPTVPEQREIILLDTHPGNPPDNDVWHSDVTFIATPPMGSILYARQVPAVGGDTSWANVTAAYEALSPALQRMLDGLTALHDITHSFSAERYGQGEDRATWETARQDNPPIAHPVIRVHPVTGQRCIFVNENFTTRIRELSARESKAVLALLFAHIARPEFTCRWRWQAGDVAFWDNRSTQHYALADYMPERRVMNRATILGDRPLGVEAGQPSSGKR